MKRLTLPVVLRAWTDCPTCGRTDRLTKAFRLDENIATPLVMKAPFTCERCGTHRAFLVLERTAQSIH
jgi:ribosomal protein S14